MMINCNLKNKKSYGLNYLQTKIDILRIFIKLGKRVGITHPATIRGTEKLIVIKENLVTGVGFSHSNFVLVED